MKRYQLFSSKLLLVVRSKLGAGYLGLGAARLLSPWVVRNEGKEEGFTDPRTGLNPH